LYSKKSSILDVHRSDGKVRKAGGCKFSVEFIGRPPGGLLGGKLPKTS